MKKTLIRLLLCLLLPICCALSCAAADALTASNEAELQSAYAIATETGASVRLTASFTIGTVKLTGTGAHAVTVNGSGNTLTLRGTLSLGCDTTFENITFHNSGARRTIAGCGNALHMTDTVSCTASNAYYPSIMAGYGASENRDSIGAVLTIDGGDWNRVRGGNAGAAAMVQSADITINGGTFHEFVQLGGAGEMADGSAVTLRVNGGNLTGGIRFVSTTGSAAADFTLIVTGGSISESVRLSVLRAASLTGSCTIRLLGGDFSACAGITDAEPYPDFKVDLQIERSLASIVSTCRETTTLSGTLLHTGMADPCMVFANGCFYLTATGSTSIGIVQATTLEGLGGQNITSNLVYKSAQDNGASRELGYDDLTGTWSPELQYFSEEEFPGQSGWYMYLALRNRSDVAGQSSVYVRMVALKSQSGSTPAGPYVHPTTGEVYASQPILRADGGIYDEWGCGGTVLRIKDGEYRGVYMMWVAEEGRGTPDFVQKIMIARMKSPWQIEGEPSAIITPTEYWETIGSGLRNKTYYAKVVEGAAPVYGKNGEIFLLYCGSGYWTNYGLGQATWNGGDPLDAASWVKYAGNPVFAANDKDGNHYDGVYMQGAGHAYFLRDAEDHLFAVYHAYPSDAAGQNKASARNAYIEACTVDYTKFNGINNGVVTFQGGDRPAPTDTAVTFTTYAKSIPMTDFSGNVATAAFVPYDAAFDYDRNGTCDLADVLLALRDVLDGGDKTLLDVLQMLRFFAS